MIRHHLTDQLLMSYAAGTLPEAFSLVAATHVSLCDDCRARLMAFEAVGGAVLEDGAAVMEAGPEACLARAGALAAPDRPARARQRRTNVLPGPLADYVGGDLSGLKWQKLGMGVRQAILPTSRRATARLLCIPGGQAVPDHGHRGLELTLVLQGAFRDSADRFGPGDVEIAGQDLEHVPTAEPGTDCICLAATDAPLRFKKWVPRVLQPVFRI